MILVVQTNISGTLYLWIVKGQEEIFSYTKKIIWHGSDKALIFVNEILQKNKISLNHIRQIIVVRGPGGFTAVRTGLIIANTVSNELHIPLLGVVSKVPLTKTKILGFLKRPARLQTVRPWYGKSPNISVPKPSRRR